MKRTIRKDPPEYDGLTIYYVTQERAFAPGIAAGWPEVIPAPHTQNGRLVRCSPQECKAIDKALRASQPRKGARS